MGPETVADRSFGDHEAGPGAASVRVVTHLVLVVATVFGLYVA